MRLVPGKHARTTERRVRAILVRYGISGWSMNVTSLHGRPDFVFWKSRVAVFINGCFWHGCPRHATKPKSNAAFWRRKLAANKDRDRLVSRILRAYGWQVIRIWECSLQRRSESCLNRIRRALNR